MPIRVLFMCVHNSARSQMAEAFLKSIGGPDFAAESAGLEAGTLNPRVVTVMHEVGIDISANPTKSAFDFFKEGRTFNIVVTVCDDANAERCPIFPGVVKRLHWSLADPSAFTGTEEQILAQTRAVRDQIRAAVEAMVVDVRKNGFNYR